MVLGPERVVGSDFEPFLRAVKPRFLLLQSSFCLGLARGAPEEAKHALDRSFAPFRSEHGRLCSDLEAIGARHRRLIEELGPTPAVVTHRLEVARKAQRAVDGELRAAGGSAYRASSTTARRLREAAFFPIQSPTEGHLLFELDHAAPDKVLVPASPVR